MADIFDEINEDLRAERARQLAMRYGPFLLIAVVLLVAGVAGWQVWQRRESRQSGEVATAFHNAAQMAGTRTAAGEMAPPRPEAAEAFARVAAEAPAGYRSLARLRAAALRANAGDLPAALSLWDQLAADTEADPLLRGLANLLWAQHQVEAGDPAAVQARLSPLAAQDNPWHALAWEAQALLALRTGNAEEAKQALRRLTADTAAPDGVRSRARVLLTRLGEAPDAPPGAAG